MDCYDVKELLKFLGDGEVPMNAKLSVAGGKAIKRLTYVPDNNTLYFDEERPEIAVDTDTKIRNLEYLVDQFSKEQEMLVFAKNESDRRRRALEEENLKYKEALRESEVMIRRAYMILKASGASRETDRNM